MAKAPSRPLPLPPAAGLLGPGPPRPWAGERRCGPRELRAARPWAGGVGLGGPDLELGGAAHWRSAAGGTEELQSAWRAARRSFNQRGGQEREAAAVGGDERAPAGGERRDAAAADVEVVAVEAAGRGPGADPAAAGGREEEAPGDGQRVHVAVEAVQRGEAVVDGDAAARGGHDSPSPVRPWPWGRQAARRSRGPEWPAEASTAFASPTVGETKKMHSFNYYSRKAIPICLSDLQFCC
jgi:hypothetical protein